MPNLTGVEPYLYSLHSRFCFKGFVYTRPINHLLPSHNPTAFKVCASPGDNVQHRCQCKSLLLLLLRKETQVPRPLVTLSSQVSLLSLLYAALGLDHYLDISLQFSPRELWLPNIHTPHTWARVCLAHQRHPMPFNRVPTADWHCPHVLTAKCMQTGCCWANINHTTGSRGQRERWRTGEKPPASGSKDCRVTSGRTPRSKVP